MSLSIFSSAVSKFIPLHPRGLRCSVFYDRRQYSNHGTRQQTDPRGMHPHKNKLIAITCLSIGVYGIYRTWNGKYVLADALKTLKETPTIKTDEPDENDLSAFGAIKSGLEFYTNEQISKHKTKETGIWVTYKSGVYDITDFVEGHPGGNLIMLAAGGSIEPFWNIYQIHRNKNILEMLEDMRIGNYSEKVTVEQSGASDSASKDPWVNEPKRSPLLTVRSEKPFNAEAPISALIDSPITPNDIFFVRNHLPVPLVDPNTYTLTIKGIGVKQSISLTLQELKERFPKHSVTMTIQCAGNRRSEMNKVRTVQGLAWSKGAISTATWSGVKLTDLLDSLKVNRDDKQIKHVHFIGLDKDPIKGNQYGASVPSFRVLDASSDVLIAYEMNGEPIPRDHGFPVRAVIPGIVGARQVKWLSEIILSSEENDSHWQHSDYKGFHASIDSSNADYSKSVAIQDYPVQSAICSPEDNSVVSVASNGTIQVSGYAWSGGGRGIIRVDVSADDGVTWHEATLLSAGDLYKQWAWTQWKVDIPVKKGDQVTITCKATDSSYCSQPEKFDGIWNFRGVLSNAWNRVTVKCTP